MYFVVPFHIVPVFQHFNPHYFSKVHPPTLLVLLQVHHFIMHPSYGSKMELAKLD